MAVCRRSDCRSVASFRVFVISIFSIFQLEVDLTFIAAILTIIGYSINDTIVIFDRIRDNLRFSKLKNKEDLKALVNNSLWQTLGRSINTMIAVVFASVACLSSAVNRSSCSRWRLRSDSYSAAIPPVRCELAYGCI